MYCSEPEEGEIHSTGKQYNDCFSDEYEEMLEKLDKFVYLIDMYKIIEDCAADLENVHIDNKYEFWKANKCLLNYVNAVFSFKEFIRHNKPSVECISEPYWEKRGWYKNTCELRNRIIHQSTIIKDYHLRSGKIYINLDELIETQQEVMKTLKNKKREDAEAFVKYLEDIRNKSEDIDGQYYLEMKYIAKQTNYEIKEMFQGIIDFLYESQIKGILEKLMAMIWWEKGINQYVFIVDDENQPRSYYEPNITLEHFKLYIQHRLGLDNNVTKKIVEFFAQNNYKIFYDMDEEDF